MSEVDLEEPVEIDEDVYMEDLVTGKGWRDPETIFNLGAVVVLALVAITTAWTGYQTARYSGMASDAGNQAAALRLQAVALSAAANDKLLIDLTVFASWMDAVLEERDEAASFYRERMRQEFVPALDAWLATSPEGNVNAPESPFVMPQYVISEQTDSEALFAQVEAKEEEQIRYNTRGDGFLFASVLLALVLFFLTMAQRFETTELRFIIAAMGLAALVWALILVARLTLV